MKNRPGSSHLSSIVDDGTYREIYRLHSGCSKIIFQSLTCENQDRRQMLKYYLTRNITVIAPVYTEAVEQVSIS
jgi:hypothetical protein